MNDEQRLAELERSLKEHFGAWTRYENDVFESRSVTIAEKIALAEAVLRNPDRGVAGHMYETARRRQLGRPATEGPSSTDSEVHPAPLEADWIIARITDIVEEQVVAGQLKANWGEIEVTLASPPIVGAKRGWNQRGWAFGMMAARWPETRIVYRGELTDSGRQLAYRVLRELHLDCQAVAAGAEWVSAALEQARRTRRNLDERRLERRLPVLNQRRALRREFRAGRLSQRQYQTSLTPLQTMLVELDRAHDDLCRTLESDFCATMRDRLGRSLTMQQAGDLLRLLA